MFLKKLYGVTGAYIGTQRICTMADRGLQDIQGVCTGADRGCPGDDGENTGGDWGRRGIFIRTGVFRTSSEN